MWYHVSKSYLGKNLPYRLDFLEMGSSKCVKEDIE